MNAPDSALRAMAPYWSDPDDAVSSHRLFIRDCRVSTWIGVFEHEQLKPTMLSFDIDLDVDGRQAADSDQIDDTVNYADVVEDLRASLADQRHRLLERLVDAVASRILSRFPVFRVRVRVAKLGILPDVAQVGVEIIRSRGRV